MSETIKRTFESLLDMFSGLLLKLLIWCASVVALNESGNSFLGFLLLISGIAWAYKSIHYANIQEKIKKEKQK